MKLCAAAVAALTLGLLAVPVLAAGTAGAPPAAAVAGCGLLAVVLDTIRTVESGGDYTAKSPGSTASGAYQFIDSSWRHWAAQAGHPDQYPRAFLAPADVQDAAARAYAQSILGTHHDIGAVPVSWYYPAALTDPAVLDIVPMPEAGNRLTIRQYQAKWLAVYHDKLATNGDQPDIACPTTDADAGADASSDGAAVVAFTRAQLGKPYVFARQGPDSYDCSGLVTAAYRTIGIEMPAASRVQARYGTAVDWTTQPVQAGDLIVTNGSDPPNGHIGIAIDATHLIHAPRTGDVVKIAPIPFDRVTTIRRLIPEAPANTGTPPPAAVAS